ncbi:MULTISPECIES: nuclear transport factor 2 family protein [unclassified Acidovorax]|uniref:nuclear transport factor 2 family protein n=1 Tax=unclassified Acidovorax TaxID=2684926 RepID=UPI0028830659|nr:MULTISPECIES: nuclear transport factor 2 family protein [unclassified Acidovorax]
MTVEGRTHTGCAAIEAWKAGAVARYTYRTEPFALHEDSGCQIVESHVAGDFPGSPVDLRYRFCLDGALIASLEITA